MKRWRLFGSEEERCIRYGVYSYRTSTYIRCLSVCRCRRTITPVDGIGLHGRPPTIIHAVDRWIVDCGLWICFCSLSLSSLRPSNKPPSPFCFSYMRISFSTLALVLHCSFIALFPTSAMKIPQLQTPNHLIPHTGRPWTIPMIFWYACLPVSMYAASRTCGSPLMVYTFVT